MKITISRRKALVFALFFLGLVPLFAGGQSNDDLARRVNEILGAQTVALRMTSILSQKQRLPK